MIQHGVHRKEDVGILRFYESADKLSDFRIKNVALVGPGPIDEAEIPTDPLRTLPEQRIVEVTERARDGERFLERLADDRLKAGGSSCIPDGGRRAVVSLPRARGQDQQFGHK